MSEHATGNNQTSDLAPNGKDSSAASADVKCDCADGKLTNITGSCNNITHDNFDGHELRLAAAGHATPKTTSTTNNNMTSCAVQHSTKNGHDDQAEHSSLSSSSSSSTSKNSTLADSEKKAKALKSLIKKRIDPNQDFIKSHNKRVKFSETMQVFLYEMPDNQMPQIIALKSPAELNLMEFQQYMFEPPAEYQDFLTFEPPPDYRDFIANSLSVFRNEVTFDYIDDDGDDDSESGASAPSQGKQSKEGKKGNHISSLVISNANDAGQNSKWQSMILDNNLDSLEEEQIIGVLKEDDILQAIGSQISLPVSSDPNGPSNGEESFDPKGGYAFEMLDPNEHYEENLSSEDFPVHHQLNSYLLNSGHLDEEDEDACCIDSSPNGSLQDLASDSSITSQDTIILINQNKSFHLEPLRGADQGMHQGGGIPASCVEDNIYENVQNRSNGELHLLSGKTLFEESNRETGTSIEASQERREIALPPDKSEGGEGSAKGGQMQQQQCDVLYENTSEMLANANAPLVANHSANVNENRLSTSSSEDSKLEGGGGGESAKNNHPVASKFRQNLMYYESMMQQNAAASHPPNVNSNSKHVPSENGRVGPNVQRALAVGVASAEASHLIPVRFPVYTIVDTNRASSSSSLSSTSSSSSSLISNSNQSHIPQTLSVVANSSSSSLSASPHTVQPAAQVSPNSSSSNSSSSNSSSSSTGMPHEYLVQYGPRTMVPGKRLEMSEPGQLGINHHAATSNAPNNFVVPSSLNNEPNMNGLFVNANSLQPQPQQQQQHSPRPSGPQPQPSSIGSSGNHNHGANQNGHSPNPTIRPGQVVYRYPYAFIQHSAANGVQTIRPVQYILQTNPQTGAQSVIYNPRLVINSSNPNQQAAYLHNAGSTPPSGTAVVNNNNNNNPNAHSMSNLPPTSSKSSVNTPAQLGQGQMMSATGHGPDSTSVSIPVRRIMLTPQGTVVGPRIMHLHQHPHPQHKQAPPPYGYYVQQRQQQAIFAYQQNVPLRATGFPGPGQVHTVDVNNQNHGHTEFPNPSEIRRRDGLYAYPQVLLKAEDSKTTTSQGAKSGEASDQNSDEKDELEEFVQQEQQRTDRIKKRYSFTEDDDPTFGFARRPSVRGIRPKFGTTNEIIQQMTSTLPKPPVQQKIVAMSNNGNVMSGGQQHGGNQVFAYGTIPKNAQFINLNHAGSAGHPQMISIVKQMGEVQLNDNPPSSVGAHLKTQTLPRQLGTMNKMPNGESSMPVSAETVRIVDANAVMMNGPSSGIQMVNCGTMSRDQLKLHLQKQLERQMHQQQQLQQKPTVAGRVALNPGVSVLGQRSLGSDERGVPEGSSFSPNHPSGSAEAAPGGGTKAYSLNV